MEDYGARRALAGVRHCCYSARTPADQPPTPGTRTYGLGYYSTADKDVLKLETAKGNVLLITVLDSESAKLHSGGVPANPIKISSEVTTDEVSFRHRQPSAV